MAGEEHLAPCDQVLMVFERPDFLDGILEEMPDRVGERVADNGADHRSEIDFPEGQAPLGDDPARHQQHRGRGHEQAQDEYGLADGHREDEPERQPEIARDRVEKTLEIGGDSVEDIEHIRLGLGPPGVGIGRQPLTYGCRDDDAQALSRKSSS
ncbi:hypothetical protein D9M68_820350 [compost metagenome]